MSEDVEVMKKKIEIYEAFLHKINMALVCGDNDMIKRLIQNADNWSYAHRVGNGLLGEEERASVIKLATDNLTFTGSEDEKETTH